MTFDYDTLFIISLFCRVLCQFNEYKIQYYHLGPESLTAYCESLLNANKFRFFCPYISPSGAYCGSEWDYVIIRRLAVLTYDEKKLFETKITENYLRKAIGIQECAKCNSLCERQNKEDRRVICPVCTRKQRVKFEFCWYCLKEWKNGSSTEECGNGGCTGEDHRLKILSSAAKKTIVGVANCPARRACPSCGMLIEHIQACKHMACICGQKFCFICLKMPAANGSYQCGSYNSRCQVAPIQKVIPGV